MLCKLTSLHRMRKQGPSTVDAIERLEMLCGMTLGMYIQLAAAEGCLKGCLFSTANRGGLV
jgi:hypothetical protein